MTAPNTPYNFRLPRWWYAVIAAGVAIRVSLLTSERLADDWYHLAMHTGRYALVRAPWQRYDFLRADVAEHAAVLARGTFPWWTSPALQLSPWRPLSSLSLALDYALFGRSALGAHLVSLGCWAALLVVFARWARAALPPMAGALALAVLATTAHATVAIGWIANRPALLSLFAVFVALDVHTRATRRAPIVVPIALAASLAAGEYGVPATLGFAACTFAARRPSWLALVLVATYTFFWRLFGFGVRGTLAYIDPFADTARWITALPERTRALVVLLLHASSAPSFVVGVAISLGVVALRRASVEHRRLAFALVTSVLMSLALVAAAPLAERLLVVAAPFFAALVGLVADAAWQPSRARALRVTVMLVVPMFLVASLLRAGLDASAFARVTRTLPRWRAPAAFDACAEPDHDHLLLAAGGFSTVHVAPVLNDALGCETPRSWRVLTLPTGALVALRTGPRSLTLSAQGNTVLLRDEARLWHQGYVARVGEVVTLPGFEVRVLAVRDGLPTQLAFAFDRSLDDARVSLWIATPDGFARVPAPPVGAGTFVPQPTEHFP